MSLLTILYLYLAFRAKQVLCDFLLQSSWVSCKGCEPIALAKNKPFSQGGLTALSSHAGFHAAGTWILMMIFAPKFWWLGIVDFAIHFLIDKCKALLVNKMGWNYKDDAYWLAFGLDQEAHNLTHLGYIIFLVLASGVPLQ